MSAPLASEGGEGCLRCGACCFSNLATYVPVRGEDYERLGERAEELVFFTDNRAYLVMHDGHCAALAITTDEDGARFTCLVYATRPTTCRELHRGSPACEGEIAEKGARPRRAHDALVALRVRSPRDDKDPT